MFKTSRKLLPLSMPSMLPSSRMPGMRPTGIYFDTPGDPVDPPPGNPNPEEVVFTPAQQTFLEKKYNEAFGKGAAKAEEKLKPQLTLLQTQLDELKSNRGTGGDPNKEGATTYTQEDVQKAIAEAVKDPQNQLSAAEKKVQALMSRDRRAAIISAAAKAKAVDAEELAVLVDRFIAHDDQEHIVVLNDNGQPRLNGKGEQMTVDEFVKQYIDARPHLKGGSGTAGAGSSSLNANQKPGKPKNASEANQALAKFFGG